jgi:drug/metabolite transporter (DMT)-like permease
MVTHNKRLLVPLAFASVYLFWGSSFVAIRYSVQAVHPAFVAGLRYLVAGIVLMAYLLLRGHPIRLTRSEVLKVTALALMMFTCNTILLGYGSKVLSAGLTALIISTIPLFIGLLETIWPGGQTMNAAAWAGTFAGFGGLLILMQRSVRDGPLTRQTVLACAALILAAFAWAAGSVFSRHTTFDAAPLVCNSWQMLIGGVINLLIGMALGGLRTSHWSTGVSFSLAYLAIFGTLAGYTSYMFLLRNVSLSAAATYAYVNPVVAVLLGWLLLRETMNGAQLLGMVVVLASVAMVVIANTEKRRHVPKEPLEAPIRAA